MIIVTRQCVACKNHVRRSKFKVTVHTHSLCIGHVPRSKFKVTVHTHSLCIGMSCSAHNFTLHGGIWKLFGTNIIKPRQHVLCKNHVATSKVKFTVHTYSLCIGLNETYSCLAHNFVVGPASGMVWYKDLVFHLFWLSHQGTMLLKALGGGISVLWTHFFSSFNRSLL